VSPGSLLFWSPLALLRLGGAWWVGIHCSLLVLSFLPKSLARSLARVSEFSLLTTSSKSMLAVVGSSGVKWGGASLSLHFTVNGAWSNGRPRNACSHKFCSTISATTQPLISGISASKILQRAAVHALGVSYSYCVAFTIGNGSANHPFSGVSADPGYRRFTCESHNLR
jgi:hypothetical protein